MPRPKTEAADYKKLMLRLPVNVHAACEQRATVNRRSLNAQILFMLEDWLTKEQSHESHRSRKS